MTNNLLDPFHCYDFWPCAPAGMLWGTAIMVLVWVVLKVVNRLIWPDLVAWEKQGKQERRQERKRRRTAPKVCLDCEVGEPHACEILFDRERETR